MQGEHQNYTRSPCRPVTRLLSHAYICKFSKKFLGKAPKTPQQEGETLSHTLTSPCIHAACQCLCTAISPLLLFPSLLLLSIFLTTLTSAKEAVFSGKEGTMVTKPRLYPCQYNTENLCLERILQLLWEERKEKSKQASN